MVKVRIRKLKEGVAFDVINANGEVVSGQGTKRMAAIRAAEAWYKEGVRTAFEARGISNIGYADRFEEAWARLVPEPKQVRRTVKVAPEASAFMELEPVGFAWEQDGVPVMNNMGSTPLEGRARVLLCYQAPLDKVPGEDTGTWKYETVRSY